MQKQESIEQLFLKSTIQQFSAYKEMAEKTFAQLADSDFFTAPGKGDNTLSVIITHMHGNMRSRWTNFLTEDGEKEWRKRDEEFNRQELSRRELMQLWEAGWRTLFNTLESLTPPDLLKTVYIRTKPVSAMEAVHRQLTHYASHVGQIVFLGKHLKGDQWQTLSVAKGASATYNQQLKSE